MIDKVAVGAAFAYPLTGLPQLIEALNGNVEGISLMTWIGFTAFTAFFLLYGIVHRVRPMIITYALWLIVDGLVVGAVLMHQYAA